MPIKFITSVLLLEIGGNDTPDRQMTSPLSQSEDINIIKLLGWWATIISISNYSCSWQHLNFHVLSGGACTTLVRRNWISRSGVSRSRVSRSWVSWSWVSWSRSRVSWRCSSVSWSGVSWNWNRSRIGWSCWSRVGWSWRRVRRLWVSWELGSDSRSEQRGQNNELQTTLIVYSN